MNNKISFSNLCRELPQNKWKMELSLSGLTYISNNGQNKEVIKLHDIIENSLKQQPSGNTTLTLKDNRIINLLNFSENDNCRFNNSLSKYLKIQQELKSFLNDVFQWKNLFYAAMEHEFSTKGWVTANALKTNIYFKSIKKPTDTNSLLDDEEVVEIIDNLGPSLSSAISLWKVPENELARKFCLDKAKIIKETEISFFNEVEKQPLNEEQKNAVINLDHRVLLNASAGSGKTAVITAKIAYGLYNGFIDPNSTVVIAFNRKAVIELRKRINQCLNKLNINAYGIQIVTFHSLGLQIIKNYSTIEPKLAKYITEGTDPSSEFKKLIYKTTIKSNSLLLKLMLYTNIYQAKSNKSIDPEALLDSFLSMCGIPYNIPNDYDHSRHTFEFEIKRGKNKFRIKVVNTKPTKKRKNYLILTRSEINDGSYIVPLISALIAHGHNPIKETIEKGLIQLKFDDSALLRVFDTLMQFMNHAENSSMKWDDIEKKNLKLQNGKKSFRIWLFLRIYRKIRQIWTNYLNQGIGFEEMLNMASDLLEKKNIVYPFSYIMIDECQDISIARARLIQNLLKRKDCRLFMVGDDWQGINRFAGSVLSVITNFQRYFGPNDLLKLETTFRMPQELADASSEFIQQNKFQLKKTVHSFIGQSKSLPVINFIETAYDSDIGPAAATIVKNIMENSDPQNLPSIFILGRYNDDKALISNIPFLNKFINNVHFSTIHSAKGLEADYVIILRVNNGIKGFPSKIPNDPILSLVIPDEDDYPFAEERRLFYVALTRAKKKVYILSTSEQISDFAEELLNETEAEWQSISISPEVRTSNPLCPVCKIPLQRINSHNGIYYICKSCRFHVNADLVEENGELINDAFSEKYFPKCPSCECGVMIKKTFTDSAFYGCSNYPKCKFTMPVEEAEINGILNPDAFDRKKYVICPKCQKGFMKRIRRKDGGYFYSCSCYPECDCTMSEDKYDRIKGY